MTPLEICWSLPPESFYKRSTPSFQLLMQRRVPPTAGTLKALQRVVHAVQFAIPFCCAALNPCCVFTQCREHSARVSTRQVDSKAVGSTVQDAFRKNYSCARSTLDPLR